MYYLDLSHIETICNDLAHSLFVDESNPDFSFKYTQKQYLESALESCKMPYYRTIFHKAATLGFQIIKGHPLLDGNKRIGMSTMIVFLLINGYKLDVKKGEILEIALQIANNKVDRSAFRKWINQNSTKFQPLIVESFIKPLIKKIIR